MSGSTEHQPGEMHEGKKSGLGGVWEKIKAHPYVTAGAVFIIGAVLIYLYYSSGTSSSSNSGQDAAAADSSAYQAELQSEALQAQQNSQLQQIQAAANAQTAQVNGAVSVNTANDQAEVDIASLQASSADQIAALQATLGTTQSNNALSATNAQTQAGENVDLADINGQVQQAQIASNTQITTGAQETGVLTTLLNGIFGSSKSAAQPVFSGTLNNNTSESTNSRIASLIPQINALPGNTLFTQQQVAQLLAG